MAGIAAYIYERRKAAAKAAGGGPVPTAPRGTDAPPVAVDPVAIARAPISSSTIHVHDGGVLNIHPIPAAGTTNTVPVEPVSGTSSFTTEAKVQRLADGHYTAGADVAAGQPEPYETTDWRKNGDSDPKSHEQLAVVEARRVASTGLLEPEDRGVIITPNGKRTRTTAFLSATARAQIARREALVEAGKIGPGAFCVREETAGDVEVDQEVGVMPSKQQIERWAAMANPPIPVTLLISLLPYAVSEVTIAARLATEQLDADDTFLVEG